MRTVMLGVLAATLVGAAAADAAVRLDPGPYRGEYRDAHDAGDRGPVTFKVANGGRKIRALEASPLAVCINPEATGGIEVVSRDFLLGTVRVKRNGRFHKTRTIQLTGDSRQVFEITGRVRHGKVKGRMEMRRRCTSTERFSAGHR